MNGGTEPPLPFAPASERNRQPILDALRERMPPAGRVLEIGAGTGQHAVFMARALPGLQWLATDLGSALPGLRARLESEGGLNLAPPTELDVLQDSWPAGPFAAAYSANTAHIMHWPAVCAMLAGVGRVLEQSAPFFLYGPFKWQGAFTTPSNEAFDAGLRTRDPDMGLRDISALEKEAQRHQLELQERLPLPVNNFLLVFTKHGGPEQ